MKKKICLYFFFQLLEITETNEKKIYEKKKCCGTVFFFATVHFNMGIMSQYKYCIVTAGGLEGLEWLVLYCNRKKYIATLGV